MGIELVKALFNTVMVTAGVTMIGFMIGWDIFHLSCWC